MTDEESHDQRKNLDCKAARCIGWYLAATGCGGHLRRCAMLARPSIHSGSELTFHDGMCTWSRWEPNALAKTPEKREKRISDRDVMYSFGCTLRVHREGTSEGVHHDLRSLTERP